MGLKEENGPNRRYGVGNPKKSSPEKGKKFFDDVTNKISELIQDICKTPLDELYQ